MWLTCSSIGRKFVMAVTGIALVLFVTFHVLMNSVAILWPAAYNVICELLGANWYALVASAGLAVLFIIHILFALWLTLQNRRARGNDRYAVAGAAPGVEWSSKNMLVLGVVVVAFLIVHLIQFWSKMQLQELISHNVADYDTVEGLAADPAYGTLFLQMAFSNWWTPVIYIIGFVALWFHMNHGFWSMFHTIGWNNNIWISRLKTISCWWTSIVVALFIAQAVVFTVQANNKFYTTDEALLDQYTEGLSKKAEAPVKAFMEGWQPAQQQAMYGNSAAVEEYIQNEGPAYLEALEPIAKAAENLPKAANDQFVGTAIQIVKMLQERIKPAEEAPAAVEEAVVEEAEAEVVESETANN